MHQPFCSFRWRVYFWHLRWNAANITSNSWLFAFESVCGWFVCLSLFVSSNKIWNETWLLSLACCCGCVVEFLNVNYRLRRTFTGSVFLTRVWQLLNGLLWDAEPPVQPVNKYLVWNLDNYHICGDVSILSTAKERCSSSPTNSASFLEGTNHIHNSYQRLKNQALLLPNCISFSSLKRGQTEHVYIQ